ncbi:MAG: hypothetical protein ACFE8B_01360 [Candidatus Hermodarchaeota archaeon]
MFFTRSTQPTLKKIILTVFLFILFTLSLQLNVLASKKVHYEKNWIENSDFSQSEDYWFTTIQGDGSDANVNIHSEQANFEVLGNKMTFSLIADPPLASNWTELDNPSFPNRPDVDEITSVGCRVSHDYDDQSAIQNPSVHWDQNITMPVNMSDYIITSASIQARVNATADENVDRYWDYYYGRNARVDPDRPVDTYGDGDYVRFYVLLSDLKKNKVYEIAYLQTVWLGNGGAPGTDYLYNTYMLSVPQEDLIYYLSSSLSTDFNNFTITLGIRLQLEDNVASNLDRDTFNELIINFVNLTFTYEKKIDRYTTISLSQIGESINETDVKVTNAVLNFNYKIDEIWPNTLSPNSELKIFINNYELEKTIKLSEMNTTFQALNFGANDIKNHVLTNVNISISIMVLLADDFELDRKITISVDDVNLIISYTVFMKDPLQNYVIWIVLIVLLVIIGILASLSLRSYILLPRKQRKRSALLLRTQKFKDAENIQGILLIHNISGLPIFSKNYSDLMEGKNELFSGFIQAISLVGQEISLKKSVRSKGFRKEVIDGIYDVIELDFKHFYCLISDIEELRTVLVLNNKASKRLKQQLLSFGLSVYAKFSETLKNWDHELEPFKETIPELLDNYFALYYKDFFKIAIKRTDLEKIKKEIKLSRNDLKVLNEIFKISEDGNLFSLMTLLDRLSDKNEDLIIDSIEILIKNNLVNPVNPINTQN